jgi:HSP20 family protein
MFEQMDRMMNDAWTTRMTGDRTPMLEGRTTGGVGSMTNLHEEDDGFVFVMDLPGFERDEIGLVYHDGHLEISASTEISEESETSFVRHSRSTNETVAIPGDVDVEGIEASYRNGVLEVALPMLDGDRDHGHEIDVR